MMDEFRPDDPSSAERATPGASQAPTPLTREAVTPRRDRWLMPLLVAGCTLAGVAMGFVMGQKTALVAHQAPPAALAAASNDEHSFKIDVDTDDDHAFAYNFNGPSHFGVHVVPPIPPMPPMGPRELVVNNCGDDDDDDRCTTIIKRRSDGSVVIVKSRRQP